MVGKILVSGAIPTHRIFLRAILTAASYQVFEATEPAELLQLASDLNPDLIILDATCDDGPWVRAIMDRCEAPARAAPVLALDREYSPASRLMWLAAGADEVVPAPVNEMVLRARVRNLLRARSLEMEAKERAQTATELGFCEAPSQFDGVSHLLIASASGSASPEVIRAVQSQPNMQYAFTESSGLLSQADRPGAVPDLILLMPEMLADGSALTAIAEIRSRQWSRAAAVIVMHHPEHRLAAVNALDLGANDVIEVDSTAKEIALRLAEQLRQRAVAQTMRDTLSKGLEMAATDPLTGLFNRRYALPHLHRIAARAAETGNPYAVLVIDMDLFKSINDRFGHAGGDAVLVSVATRLRENVRAADLVARIGGEEFLVIMPETDLEAAKLGAERLRQVIASDPVLFGPDNTKIHVTASLGVVAGTGCLQDDAEHMIELADKALYAAKHHGRNLVEAGKCAA